MLEQEREIKSIMSFDDHVDKWIVMWEHEYNYKEKQFKEYLGSECCYDLVDKLSPRDSVKGGCTEVFRTHAVVRDVAGESISYLDVNSVYPYVMATIDFPNGHPVIQRGDQSCGNLLHELHSKNEKSIGLCQVRVLARNDVMIPSLGHKTDGKLIFFLCRTCSLDGHIQRYGCSHTDYERLWIDTYMSIDMDRALHLEYVVLEYKEIWHYPKGGKKVFKDFILSIVRRKIECLGFPLECVTEESRARYIRELREKCGINTSMNAIRHDPAGRYLNKMMVNSMWGKWTQNPSSQQGLITCSTIQEYHNCLFTGRVMRVTLVADKLLQVEMKHDRNMEGENRERENNRSGLGEKNPIVEAFVTAGARDLMYDRYLSTLHYDQLLYTDTDSVTIYHDKSNDYHVTLPTSDLLDDLKMNTEKC